MGFQLLNFIAQQCQSLTASTAPTIDAIGLRIVLSLATIMLVWFGIQEALASAQGGQGFNMARFLNFFMLISFAYMFVLYYDSSIPGIGYSLKSFISDGTTDLANTIGHDATVSMLQSIDTSLQKSGPGMAMFTAPYMMVAYILNQISLAVLAALVSVIIAYGEIAAAIIGLLGPIFIPFLIIEKLEFLFWGWLRAFIGFCFYKVLAAAVLSILAHLLAGYYTQVVAFSDPGSMVQELPLLILLVFVNIYILFKVPAMTQSLFGGHTGGHDGGMGVAMMAIRAAL